MRSSFQSLSGGYSTACATGSLVSPCSGSIYDRIPPGRSSLIRRLGRTFVGCGDSFWGVAVLEVHRRGGAAGALQVVLHPLQQAQLVVELAGRAAVAVTFAGVAHEPHRRLAHKLQETIQLH